MDSQSHNPCDIPSCDQYQTPGSCSLERSKFSENIAWDKEGNRYISERHAQRMLKIMFNRQEKIIELRKENKKLREIAEYYSKRGGSFATAKLKEIGNNK